jgi:hypothetical protein
MKKAIALLLAVTTLLCLCACGKDDQVSETEGNSNNNQSQVETTKPSENDDPVNDNLPTIPMGDELGDFTISVDGNVIQFPCKLQDLIDRGWLPLFADTLDDAKAFDRIISGGDMCNLALYHGEKDKKIFALIYNPGKNDIHYLDGTVRGAYKEAGSTATITVPGGLVLKDNLTPEELIAALGEDYSNKAHSKVYTYTCSGGHYTFDFSGERLYWQIETAKKKAN